MNEIPENLKQAMSQYAEKVELMNSDVQIRDLNAVRNELMKQITDVDSAIKNAASKYMELIAKLEEDIQAQVFEIGGSVMHAGVEAKHVSGYVSVTWQKKIIDKILFDNPALIPTFKPAKKETPVSPRVTVTYVGKEEEPEEKRSVAYSREDAEAAKGETPF